MAPKVKITVSKGKGVASSPSAAVGDVTGATARHGPHTDFARSVGTETVEPEHVVISDNDEERTNPSPAQAHAPRPEPKASFDGFAPRVPPLAEMAPGQERAFPDPETALGLVRRLENGVNQATMIVGAEWGRFTDFYSFIGDSLREIERVAGTQLARRCEQRIIRLEMAVKRMEKLHDEAWELAEEMRVRMMREHATLKRRVLEQEVVVANLRERQRHLQREMAACDHITDRTGARTAVGEHLLKKLRRESTDVHRTYTRESQVLHALHREGETTFSTFSKTQLLKDAEAQLRVTRAREIADIRAEFSSFSLLD